MSFCSGAKKNDIYFLETSSDICLNHCLLKYYFLFHYWILDTKFAAAAESLQSCLTLSSPIDGSPPGSPHPWDSPGKNTGVGCHFLLQCMKVKSESEVAQSCPALSDLMDCSLSDSSIHGFSRQI